MVNKAKLESRRTDVGDIGVPPTNTGSSYLTVDSTHGCLAFLVAGLMVWN